jgi:hypothetical protein
VVSSSVHRSNPPCRNSPHAICLLYRFSGVFYLHFRVSSSSNKVFLHPASIKLRPVAAKEVGNLTAQTM